MALSHELISQFAKQIAVKDKVVNKESTVYGTIHIDDNGKKYVQLDGSDQLTPLTVGDLASSMSVNAKDGERVSVLIKNHTATVVGNMSSPAARTGDVDDAVAEFDVIVVDHVQAVTAYVDQLQANNAKVGDLEAANAKIGNLETDVANIKEAQIDEAEINNLIAKHAKIGSLEADVAEIKELKADKADVTQLNTEFLEFGKATGDSIKAHQAAIDDLETKKLSAESADLKYANIDFANIDKAAIETFFAKSGVIEDWTSENGIVTGKLVAVSIDADNITSGSLLAERIMLQGDDGLFYKLNVDAMGKTTADALPQAEQEKLKNGIHGKSIIAESITADKISVSDLVAFGATIGGFHITNDSLYSGVKSGVNNTTRGIYLDNDGQIAFGDSSNFVKFYKDTDGAYKLAIRAESLTLGSGGKSVESAIEDVQKEVETMKDDIATNRIESVEVGYQVGTSPTVPPTGTWSTNPVATTTGQYLWTRTVTVYADPNVADTTAYSVAAHGATGGTGEDGKGIKSAAVTYQVGTSATAAPTGTWSSSIVSTTAPGQYLWTKTVITYTDNTTTTSYAIATHGATGATGAKGDAAIAMVITSSNGTVFKNSSGSTVLTAHVFVGGEEQTITDAGVCGSYGTVKWYKGTGTTSVATGKTYTIRASDVATSLAITAQLE